MCAHNEGAIFMKGRCTMREDNNNLPVITNADKLNPEAIEELSAGKGDDENE